jgi:hypothetical protein
MSRQRLNCQVLLPITTSSGVVGTESAPDPNNRYVVVSWPWLQSKLVKCGESGEPRRSGCRVGAEGGGPERYPLGGEVGDGEPGEKRLGCFTALLALRIRFHVAGGVLFTDERTRDSLVTLGSPLRFETDAGCHAVHHISVMFGFDSEPD